MRPAFGSIAVLALAVLSLGRASPPAGAALSDYQPTLYLSGAPSGSGPNPTVVSGAYQIVNSQGLSTTARPMPSATVFCGNTVAPLNPCAPAGNLGTSSFGYSYRYTLVDASGGETAPSASVTAPNVKNGEITVGNLPTGVTVRIYRDPTTGSTNGPWKRVVELPNNSSSTYLDNIPDASLGAILPQSQTRTATFGGTGYYEWIPGNGNPTSATSGNFPTPQPASPAFDGKGWVDDAPGGVSFAAGTWAITVKITSSGSGTSAAGLDIGMWVVNDSGGVVCTLVDPTGAASTSCYPPTTSVSGVNPSGANISTAAGTASAILSNLSLPAFKIDRDQHLYVQFWRHQTANSTGTTLSTFAVYDGTAQITHPAANGYPDDPALGSVAPYVNATPTLSATYTDPDADTGSLQFQLRSDNNCSDPASALATTTVNGLANNASPTWTPPVNLANKGTYPDGTYYWCVQATDSASNVSDWSTGSFVVDTVPPTVSGVTASNGNGAYNAGKTIHVQVGFSEPVNVTGTPKLALNTVPAESATYVSGSGTSTLTFDYTVGATDNVGTLDYANASALMLNGGTIADRATNAATPGLPAPGAAGSLGANTSIAIDTIPPTVSGVSATSGAYKAGQTIHVQIGFDESVNVTGSPQLALNTTPAESATYVSGSGTSTLMFDYTVQAGDNVDPLDYASTGALTLNGGTIADLAGNAGTLTLAPPGASGSIAASASVRVDTNAPNTPIPSSPAAGVYLGAVPALKAKYSDGDTGGTGTVNFQICTDNTNCAGTVVVPGGSGSSASGLANGATGSWTPGALPTGVYYWQATGTDTAGNQQAAWTTPSSFTVDVTPPVTTPVGSIAARVKVMPQISATYSDPPYADTGKLTFQLCADLACTSVLQNTTQNGVASGGNGSWTPASAADGLYYWKVTGTDSVGNTSSTSGSFTFDTVAPAKPALGSPANALRVNSPPTLNATFTNSDPTDSGTVTIELCSDAVCATVLNSSTSATVASGAGFSMATGPLTDGTYYWRASSLDAAGNQGAWSAVRSFVLDTNPPAVSQSSPADGARVNASTLKATFSTADAGDSGTVSFQVCSDASCATVVASGSGAGLVNGATAAWTPTGLADGVYYWRVSAQDAAGNQTSPQWTPTRTFTLDSSPPPLPTTTGSLVDAVRLNQPPTLTAVYNDPSGGTGSLEFELCPTISCATPILTSAGATGSLADGAAGSWTPSFLFDGLYYWRVRSVDSAGNTSGWSAPLSFSVDATPPAAPVLWGASGMRVPSAPVLAARVDDPTDPGDEARIFVEICGDATCTTILANGYSETVPVGTLVSWQSPGLGTGTYYWRALGEDVVGNRSAWSATRTFVVDTDPPAVPQQGGMSEAALVNRPRLSGTFSDVDPGDSGTLEFQVCTDADCTTVVAGGSSASVAAGGTGSWTAADTLDDGVYFWRVRAVDAAGNASVWSPTRSFTLDQTPPGRPQDFSAQITGQVLTLTWRPPPGSKKIRGYALIVNGKKTRTLSPKTRTVRIHLLQHDTRSFAVAAIDEAGNMSEATRTIATFAPPLSMKQARSSALRRHP